MYFSCVSGKADRDLAQTGSGVGAFPDIETCLLSKSSCEERGAELFLTAARMAYDEAYFSV